MKYHQILKKADLHFARVAEAVPQHLECRLGCTGCCHGLFEVALVDMTLLEQGLAALPAAERETIVANARGILEMHPHPLDWEGTADGTREQFFEETSGIPCPCLKEDGGCAVYEHRPLLCRTFGLPIRDGDRFIGDECELNFTRATDREKRDAAWNLADEEGVDGIDEITIPQAIVRIAGAPGAKTRRGGGSKD